MTVKEKVSKLQQEIDELMQNCKHENGIYTEEVVRSSMGHMWRCVDHVCKDCGEVIETEWLGMA